MMNETFTGTWRIIKTMDDGMVEENYLPYWTFCKGPPQVVRIRTKVVIWRGWRPGQRSPSRWSKAGDPESFPQVSACENSRASGVSVSFFSSLSPKGPFRVSVYDKKQYCFCFSCCGIVVIFVKGNIWIIRERKYSECGIGIFFPRHSASLNALRGCRCINTNRSYLASGIEQKSKTSNKLFTTSAGSFIFVVYLFELSKAASNILFHILETPTSELIRGTSLSVLGSCQLQDLKYGKYKNQTLQQRLWNLKQLRQTFRLRLNRHQQK